MTLLVIEDDPGVGEVVQLLLTREGYGVQRAGTVNEGLRCLDAHKIDLVITDLKLPDGTGLDVIRSIHDAHPALPIILMTSYSSMESAIAALRAGALDYIVKPFNNDEFIRAVERALNGRPAKGLGGGRPLAIEDYIREVIERFQGFHSETELARMLGIGRKALWMRRRQWGLKRVRKNASR
jgi:DNA-binding NtrC family response regulator